MPAGRSGRRTGRPPPGHFHPGGALRAWPAAGGVFVTCDGRNLPVGMMLPLAPTTPRPSGSLAQARASLPMRKRLWRQIVRAKIKAQAALWWNSTARTSARALAGTSAPGDPSNVEARAARRYWHHVFADPRLPPPPRKRRPERPAELRLRGVTGDRRPRHLRRRSAPVAGHPPPQPLRRLLPGRRPDGAVSPGCRPTPWPNTWAPTTMPTSWRPRAKQHIIGELTGRYVMDGAAAHPV